MLQHLLGLRQRSHLSPLCNLQPKCKTRLRPFIRAPSKGLETFWELMLQTLGPITTLEHCKDCCTEAQRGTRALTLESWRRNAIDKSTRLFARFTRRGKKLQRVHYQRSCQTSNAAVCDESPNNVLTVWKAMIASSSVASFAVRRRAVWNSCSSVFMKSKVMERFKETRLVVCLLLFLTLCVDLGFEFGRNKDSEFTFLLPAGATECFFQTTSKNGSIEVEYQVNKIF